MLNSIKRDIFQGWSLKSGLYAIALIAFQIIFYVIYPENPFSFIAGVSGIAAVVLTAQRKAGSYYFGLIQTAILLVVGFEAGLIGETGENLFYFITQFVGMREWKKHLVTEDAIVETRKLSVTQWIITVLSIVVLTVIVGSIFASLNGTQPFIDSLTLIIAFVGQFLMVKRYREQWTFWGVLNVVSLYQWFTLGNMSLVALYIGFLINTVYGYVKWNQGVKQKEEVATV